MREAAALVTDLIFRARLREFFAAREMELRFIRGVSELAAAVDSIQLLVVDLQARGEEALPAIKLALSTGRDCTVVAYCSHVERDLMEQARSMGAQHVCPRSELEAVLNYLCST